MCDTFDFIQYIFFYTICNGSIDVQPVHHVTMFVNIVFTNKSSSLMNSEAKYTWGETQSKIFWSSTTWKIFQHHWKEWTLHLFSFFFGFLTCFFFFSPQPQKNSGAPTSRGMQRRYPPGGGPSSSAPAHPPFLMIVRWQWQLCLEDHPFLIKEV